MTDIMAKHPYRRTYSQTPRRPIAPDTLMGRSSNLRDTRARWHILDAMGIPLCLRQAAIGETARFADIDGRVCSPCHHEHSWQPVPTEFVEEDRGFATPCWIWTRGVDNDGYGQRGRQRRWVMAHRATYEAEYGPIPEGWVIHHQCGQPACLNPEHLEAMSRADHCRLHRPGDHRVYT